MRQRRLPMRQEQSRHDTSVAVRFLNYSEMGHTQVREIITSVFPIFADVEGEDAEGCMTPFTIASSCSKLSALRPETINEVLKFLEGKDQGYVTAGKESVAHTLTVQQGTLQFQSEAKQLFDGFLDCF